ncbi:MAG TPA: hypothetical protein VHM26_12635 [Chitinophagaceae bacterium]|jgi:hypothetical protein|nr:hypothetical protein [Chitinophagaceae bacterium]
MSISQCILVGSLLMLIGCSDSKEEQTGKLPSILKDTVKRKIANGV